MSIANEFLAEYEAQAPITRKFLERIPANRLTFQPHSKSMTIGQLALHIANVPGGILRLCQNNPALGPGEFRAPHPTSLADILKAFDEDAAVVRGLLPTLSDTAMKETWVLKIGGRTAVEQPRADFLRDVMFSHVYQHRGQLCVYLRMLNVAVPASWGPSADELPVFMQHEANVA